jgi:hypothetical protein
MARYIDADKFLQDEIKRCGCVPLVGSCTTDNESLAYQLSKAPTADVVEVVRCRDCRHCEIIIDQFDNDWYFCKNAVNNAKVEADDFCSYGERRNTDA